MLKVGFVFLMMLMVFVLYNDIAKRIAPGLFISHSASSQVGLNNVSFKHGS